MLFVVDAGHAVRCCLCWVMDTWRKTGPLADCVGREGQAGGSYPSVWIPSSLSLLFRQGKLPDCSQLCKPRSLEGESALPFLVVFLEAGSRGCFTKRNNDIFRDLALF